MLGLGLQIGHVGNRQLHATGELVAGDACGEVSVPGKFTRVLGIEGVEQIPRAPVRGGGDAVGPAEIRERPRGTEVGALKRSRQEARAPVVFSRAGLAARIIDRDERGQLLVGRAERIGHPSAEGGKAL